MKNSRDDGFSQQFNAQAAVDQEALLIVGLSLSNHANDQGEVSAETASLREKMAYKLRTRAGKALYRRRKCTIEPVFGQIKEVMGFRQLSLRGLSAAAGEWCLVCLAYNLRRLHRLTTA